MQPEIERALAVLVQSGALDETQASACAREADATGESALTCAIRRGLLTPEQVSNALGSPDRSRAPARSAEVQRFGNYEIVRRLGEGGMGVVYEAIDPRLGRAVALKVLAADRKVSEQTIKRFEREARVVARLAHPNVCAVHEAGEVGGRAYFTMELVRGQSLAGVIEDAKGAGLEWDRACRIVRDAARGLAHAHEQGIVHRDVKPSNILIGAGDRALVVDFGLARDEDVAERLTKTGQLLGTPVYMAPERFDRRYKDSLPAVDIYALGVTLYEALSGSPPFAAANVLELVSQIKRGSPPPPRTSAGCPDAVKAVCIRALAAVPERRYPTAASLALDLDRVLSSDPGSVAAARVSEVEKTLVELTRARPGVVLLALGSLLVFAVGLGVFLGKTTARSHSAVASPEPSPTRALATPLPTAAPVTSPSAASPSPLPSAAPVSVGPPRTEAEALARARAYVWEGDLEAAETAYRTALELAPESADAGLERVLVGNLLQEPSAATELQRLVAAHPEHTIARIYAEIANTVMGQERSKKLEKRMAESPVGPLLRILRAQSLEDAALRRREMKSALAERPTCGFLAAELAQDLALDMPEEALRVLDEPRHYEGVAASFRAFARAFALLRLKRNVEADAALALVEGPPTIAVTARGQRALLAIDRGDPAAAVALHEGKEPGTLADRVALARALIALERDKDARAVLDLAVRVAEEGGDTVGIYRAIGASEADLRLARFAEQLVVKTDRERDLGAVRGRRGRLAARGGDLETAQADVDELKGDVHAAERRATKGTIALVKGDAAEAERLFAKALERPEAVEPDVYLDRALALERTGDVAGAIAACKAARDADPLLRAAATAQIARLERAGH